MNSTTQPTVSSSEEVSPEQLQPVQSTSKFPITVLLSLIIVLLLGGMTYLYFQIKSLQKSLADKPTQETVKATPVTITDQTTVISNTNTPVPDTKFSNWIKHEEPSYHLSFLTPPTITAIEKGDATKFEPALILSMGLRTEEAFGKSQYIAPVEIYIGDKNSEQNDFYYGGFKWTEYIVNDLMTRKPGDNFIFTKEGRTFENEVLVAGTKAYKYKAQPSEAVAYTGVAFIKKDKSYLIIFNADEGNMSATDFSKFLSSILIAD